MITCPTCGQQTETGKFCTHCGANLEAAKDAAAAAEPMMQGEPTERPADSTSGVSTQAQQSNATAEKLKDVGANFGHFFTTLLKKPDNGCKATKKDFISGIITLAIFAIIVSFTVYIFSGEMASYLSDSPFVDLFLKPLFYFLILIVIMLALTFGGMKMTGHSTDFPEVIAKFGAYTVPFLILLIIGLLFSFVSTMFGGALLMLSILGITFFTPTFVLFEKRGSGSDRIYVLLGIYIVSTLVSGFMMQSVVASMLESMMGGFLGGF